MDNDPNIRPTQIKKGLERNLENLSNKILPFLHIKLAHFRRFKIKPPTFKLTTY